MKHLAIAAAVIVGSLTCTSVAIGATPDGLGPWADSIQSVDQKRTKNGSAVLPARSDPNSALGVAEDTDVDGTFFSLGFGGSVTLGFDNNVCNAPGADVSIKLREATREPFPDERVNVYVSSDGQNFVLAASNVNKDAEVSLPDSVNVARYVRLVDVSDPNIFTDPLVDGYDVDGVKALNSNCNIKGKIVGAGTSKDGKEAHAFLLRCDKQGKYNSVVVTWKDGWTKKVFGLKTLDSALCSDDPSISENPPNAGFDTYQGSGTGLVNGKSGYTIDFTFTDAGEPGKDKDSSGIVIKDANGIVVLSSGPAAIKCGEHQAFPTWW